MTLAIDGSPAEFYGSGVTNTLTGLTTTNAGDVIVVCIYGLSDTLASITSPNLTFTQRCYSAALSFIPMYIYWAVNAAPLSNEIITLNWNSGSGLTGAVAFAVSGANTSTPFDTNVSLPNTGTTDPGTVSTTATNTMILGWFRSGNSAPTNGPGYTQLSAGTPSYAVCEYQIVAAAQTNLSVTMSNTDAGSGVTYIADAIQAAAGGGQSASPGAGLIAFSGLSPSADETVNPGAGLIAFAGHAPTTTPLPITVAPGVGRLSIKGFSPSPLFTTIGKGGPDEDWRRIDAMRMDREEDDIEAILMMIH